MIKQIKTLFLIANLITISFFTWAQKGQIFPTVEGETLTGKSVTLPAAAKGKCTLMGVAYSQKSEELLKQWYQPIYTHFVEQPESSFVPTEKYDVNLYFVALLKGIYKTVDGTIEKKMKQGLNAKYHPMTVLYKGNIQDYKKTLVLDDKDLPYFFVLDANGKIVYHTSGAYSTRKLGEIMEAIDELSQ